jgi:AcrR family transcriptional regulator
MAAHHDIPLPQTRKDADDVPAIAERIMQAAIQLFGRKGYSATSVREIVQEADVTNPMLYYYFDSKEGLFRKLMDFLFHYMQERIEVIVEDDSLNLNGKICAITRSHLEGVRDHPEVLRFVYSAIFGPTESRPDIDVHAMHMRTHNMVEQMFAEAIEAGEIALARPNLDASRCAELLLGAINQDLMRTLGVLEIYPDDPNMVEHLTGAQAVERITAFFLGGVGTIGKDTQS